MTDERLVWAIRETEAGLVVLDPLQAYLGEKVDMHRANEVRPRMKHLGDIAAEYKCGMVLTGHLNKKETSKAEYRGLGSMDFTAAARSVILCAELPRDKDVRVLASTKCSLTYPPEPVAFRLSKERGFEWEGNYSITAEELLQGTGVKGQKTIEAKEFLAAELPAPGEYIPSTVLMEKAKEKKIAEKTLRNAMKDLGITSHKEADRWFTGYAV